MPFELLLECNKYLRQRIAAVGERNKTDVKNCVRVAAGTAQSGVHPVLFAGALPINLLKYSAATQFG
jgi:hypothetical protein